MPEYLGQLVAQLCNQTVSVDLYSQNIWAFREHDRQTYCHLLKLLWFVVCLCVQQMETDLSVFGYPAEKNSHAELLNSS